MNTTEKVEIRKSQVRKGEAAHLVCFCPHGGLNHEVGSLLHASMQLHKTEQNHVVSVLPKACVGGKLSSW